MTDENKITTIEEARAAAENIALGRAIVLLAGHQLDELTPLMERVAVLTEDKNMAALKDVILAELKEAQGDDEDYSELNDFMTTMLGGIEDYLRLMSRTSLLFGVCAAHAGLVPYGAANPSLLDAINLPVMDQMEGWLERCRLEADNIHSSPSAGVIAQFSEQAADQFEGSDISVASLVYSTVVSYCGMINAARHMQQGITDGDDNIARLLDRVLEEAASLANGPTA